VERPAVNGAPATVFTAGDVGDDAMAMKLRLESPALANAASAVIKLCDDELGKFLSEASFSATNERNIFGEPVELFVDRCIEGGFDQTTHVFRR
jgi:hypothetical protein